MLMFTYQIDERVDEIRMIEITKVIAKQDNWMIAESPGIGKFLSIGNSIQTSEKDYVDYHIKLLANIPSVPADEQKFALVLGAGEGVTGSMLSYYGYHVTEVDKEPLIYEACKQYLGWYQDYEPIGKKRFVPGDGQTILEENDMTYDVIVLDYNEEKGYGNYKQIDIWWRGGSNNGNLVLSLIKLIRISYEWRHANVRLLLINYENSMASVRPISLTNVLKLPMAFRWRQLV